MTTTGTTETTTTNEWLSSTSSASVAFGPNHQYPKAIALTAMYGSIAYWTWGLFDGQYMVVRWISSICGFLCLFQGLELALLVRQQQQQRSDHPLAAAWTTSTTNADVTRKTSENMAIPSAAAGTPSNKKTNRRYPAVRSNRPSPMMDVSSYTLHETQQLRQRR